MSDITYGCTSVTVTLKDGTKRLYQAGQVVRPTCKWGFSDCIILGFSDPTKHGDIYVKVARPYASASCIGTTGPTAMVGIETFGMTMNQILAYEQVGEEYHVVEGGRKPVDRPYEDEKLTYLAR